MISCYNTVNQDKILNAGSCIFTLYHKCKSILITNLTNGISRYAQINIFNENKSSDVMHVQVLKSKGKPQAANSIHKLDKDQSRLALSSAHLLKQLLNMSFGFSPDDLREMQRHDTH